MGSKAKIEPKVWSKKGDGMKMIDLMKKKIELCYIIFDQQEEIKTLKERLELLKQADEYVGEKEHGAYLSYKKLEEYKSQGILDIEHFKYQLILSGLMNLQLERFINEYMRYYNKGE